jgi:type II secretory pathway pseudopilin PulG
MGQQQLLLIILGVIIVGIAIAVGLQLFQSGSIGANSDALINDMMNIAAHADQYRIRPESMGGGGGSFDGYLLPTRLEETGNGTFTAVGAVGVLTVVGTSTPYEGSSWTLTYDVNAETDAERYTWVPAGLFE